MSPADGVSDTDIDEYAGDASEPCAGCGLVHRGEYCPRCGEPVIDPSRLSLGHLLRDGLRGITDLDSRLWRTTIDLLRRPGELTRAWAEGPRSRYLPTASIFLTVTLVVFFVAPYTGVFGFDLDNYLNVGPGQDLHLAAARAAAEASGVSGAEWTAVFDARVEEVKRALLVLLIPALAIVVALTAPRRRRPFAVHVVFAVHGCAFMLIWLTLTAVVARVATIPLTEVSEGALEAAIAIALLGPISAWSALAFGRVYGGGRLESGVRAVLLLAGVLLGSALYRECLFWVTLVLT